MNLIRRDTPMKTLRLTVLSAMALAGAAGCASSEAQKIPDPAPVAPVAAPKESSVEEQFTASVQAFEQGKLDEAQAGFEKILKKQPDLTSARFNLALVAERKADVFRAQEQYEAVLAVEPDHTPSLLNLGRIYRLQGKVDKAIALYEGALQRPGREHDVQLLNNLTVAYRLAKQYAKAEATARRVLSRSKDNAEAYKNLAVIYYDQGNYRLAEFISANARKLDEKDPGVYNNLGMIYLKMDDRPRALAQFQKAVQLSDNFAPGHMNIGAMALAYRDYETAEKAFSKVVNLDPLNVEAHLNYAYALDGQKGRDPKKGLAAAAQFEKVLQLRPDAPEAICGAGWAYSVEKGGWEKAVSYLEKCKAQAPNLPEVEKQTIDAKLRALAAMIKSGAQQPAPEKREAPKPAPQGTSLLDKASAQEAATEAAEQPAAPADGAAQPAPAPAPAPQGQ